MPSELRRDPRPIALFDSGVGGLSILREVRKRLPNENILYFADQEHVPYGPRPLIEIQSFVYGVAWFFAQHNAKAIVIACNAASAAGLHHARQVFPEIPFVGMEPAVKPAAEHTQSGVIGVITTKATYQGELFASAVDRFASNIQVVTQVCPEFVTLVETGKLDGPEVEQVARSYLGPLLEAKIDELVLGCTHFPFLTPVIQRIVGEQVEIIDPGPAIARQTRNVIAGRRNAPKHIGRVAYFTSGDPGRFQVLAMQLIGDTIEKQQVLGVRWVDGKPEVIE